MIEKIPLNSLRFFYHVADCGSVTLASEKLFVTQSAVSKQIKTLEHSLNVPLFDRINKTLVLTDKGQALYECCQRIFPSLDACLADIIATDNSNQPLVLSCEPTFAMKWLIPRLPKFNALNVGFDILLLTGGGAVDFAQKNIDLAIRRNDFDFPPHVYQEKIADEYIMAVTTNQSANDETLLITSSRPNFLSEITKLEVLPKTIENYQTQTLEHFYLCIQACMAGIGVTVVSAYTIENELNSNLLHPLSNPTADGSAYYLLSKLPFSEDDRKFIFLEWFKNEMAVTIDGFKSATLYPPPHLSSLG